MKYTLFIIFCAFQTVVYSHDYFFAFAEIEYNDVTQKLESTIVISSHDLEIVLNKKELSIDSLSNMNGKSALYRELNSLLSKHFQIRSGDSLAKFNLLGGELLLNGMVNLFMQSEPIEIVQEIDIFFDLLMYEFPEQQNKLTFYHRDKTYTATFMQATKTNEIRFDYN